MNHDVCEKYGRNAARETGVDMSAAYIQQYKINLSFSVLVVLP